MLSSVGSLWKSASHSGLGRNRFAESVTGTVGSHYGTASPTRERGRCEVRDFGALLERVQAGAEVVIERDAQPLAVIRAAAPARRTISERIALAGSHEKETGQSPVLDPDFAADVEEIVRNRRPWTRATRGEYSIPAW